MDTNTDNKDKEDKKTVVVNEQSKKTDDMEKSAAKSADTVNAK